MFGESQTPRDQGGLCQRPFRNRPCRGRFCACGRPQNRLQHGRFLPATKVRWASLASVHNRWPTSANSLRIDGEKMSRRRDSWPSLPQTVAASRHAWYAAHPSLQPQPWPALAVASLTKIPPVAKPPCSRLVLPLMPPSRMPPLPSPFSVHHHLTDWIGCTLEIRCGCGRASMPSILMLLERWADRPFADLMLRLRCEACGAKPAQVWLVAGRHRSVVGGPGNDWAVEVKGG